MMNQFEKIKQAYPQAPWRSQLQMVGFFLVIVVLIALIAGFYLNVSAQAAAIGRDIQGMQSQVELLEQENENLKAVLANLSSSRTLDNRAREMDFKQFDPEQAMYLLVPGYAGREPVILAPSNEKPIISAPVLPEEYTESLFHWLYKYISPFVLPFFEE